ncbi:hypothetical protein D3C86_1327470 [compost metagenome]
MGRRQIENAIVMALPLTVVETLFRRHLAAKGIRQGHLVLRQHIDDEIRPAQQQFMQQGAIVQANQQRRRLHRD